MTTPRLGAPELATSQANKEETVNEQIRYLEAGAGHFIFKDRDLATPPGSPADGDCYLVAGSPTGAWTGHAGDIAFYLNTAWVFIEVIEGFTAWVNDENVLVGYDGSSWTTLGSPSGVYQPLDSDLTAIAGLTPSQGDVIYHNGTQWTRLAAGTSGQFLKTLGAGANPAWDAVASAITAKDEGSNLTTSMSSVDFVGAGVTATNVGGAVTVTIPGGGGGGGTGAWQLQWGPLQSEAPASNYASLDTRNSHPVLDFDTTTQEATCFHGVLPNDYAGGGITVSIWCAIDASSLDIDADSFATAQTITAATVPGTSGQVLKQSVNIADGTDMDSLAAGELFRIRIRRDVANDTATGDAELLRVMMEEQ
jgi:hypothetical protein